MEQFENAYKQLNTAQKQAVDTIEGPVMVVAGPGTGKTQILAMRIANIIAKTDTEPDSVLALTFTEAGVASMRKRLATFMGADAYRVGIFTFHGFANEIIRNYSHFFPMLFRVDGAGEEDGTKTPSPLTDIDQIAIIQNILENSTEILRLRPFGDPYHYIKAIQSAIDNLKREGITPEHFSEMVAQEHEAFGNREDTIHQSGAHAGKMKGDARKELERIEKNKELALVYAQYQEKVREERRYDFADMLIETIAVLRNHDDVKMDLQEQYQYVLVDEHQDTNNAQNTLVELLVDFHESPNIFAVGDPKQSIYRFQGASLENFYYFSHKYAGAQIIELFENYRSTQHILDASLSLMPSAGDLSANAPHTTKPIEVRAYETNDYEMFGIAEMIQSLLGQDVSAEEIAILVRNNRDGHDIARWMLMMDIPHQLEARNDVYDAPCIQNIMILLRMIAGWGTDAYVAPFLYLRASGITTLDASKILRKASRGRSDAPLHDILHNTKALKEIGVDVQAVEILVSNIDNWVTFSREHGALEAIDHVMHESHMIDDILGSEDNHERIEQYRAWYDHVRRMVQQNPRMRLADVVAQRDIEELHGVAVKSESASGRPGRVRIMTAHKSKGLEFDYVFIPGAYDKHWGNQRSRNILPLIDRVYKKIEEADRKQAVDTAGLPVYDPTDKNGDERRLFFVAMTRARKHVVVSYSETDSSGRATSPSVFLTEIKSELVEHVEDADIAQRFEKMLPALMRYSKKDTQKNKALHEYLVEQFEKTNMSVSALNNYLKSPWLYIFRNLLRLPQHQKPHLEFGNAVHGALEALHEETKNTGDDPGLQYLLDQFDARISASSMTETHKESYQDKGHQSLSAWYEAYKSELHPHAENEVGIYDVVLDDVKLSGKLDKIEPLDITNPAVVRVVDYKTGRQKTRNQILGETQDSSGDIYRQLVFYKLLLKYHKGGRYTMSEGMIDFIEPDSKTGKLRREVFTPTDDEVIELEQVIKKVAHEIRTLSFWNEPIDESLPELEEYLLYIHAMRGKE